VWNGAIEHLKAKPVAASAIPVNSIGSVAETLSPIAAEIALKSVAPVAP
jgi:hypothetical protein